MHLNGKKYTILLICSSERTSIKLKKLLEEEQFTVICQRETSGITSLSKNSQIDLIVLIPENSSSAACRFIQEIRKQNATSHTPIIFISSIEDDSIISECLNFDNTDFIAKPIREKELLLRVKHQLSLLEAKRTIRRQNDCLKQTIESRDKLYAVIAHDLRAPIATIKMINASIENEKNKIRNTNLRKKIEMISTTTEEVFNLLENLLRWTRNQTGRTKMVPGIFDVAACIREVLSLFTHIANIKHIDLNNHIQKPVYVYADEDMIKTVLRNLISNAIKFTFPKGQVDILLSENNEQVTIAVKDNGQGIKKEDQKKILKNDHSFSTYGTKNEKGSGLGLSLSQDFIKLNKGKLRFASQEGEGTIFYFTIPAAQITRPTSLPVH